MVGTPIAQRGDGYWARYERFYLQNPESVKQDPDFPYPVPSVCNSAELRFRCTLHVDQKRIHVTVVRTMAVATKDESNVKDMKCY
jgi:hypothetical protein